MFGLLSSLAILFAESLTGAKWMLGLIVLFAIVAWGAKPFLGFLSSAAAGIPKRQREVGHFTCPECRGRLTMDLESVPNEARAALDNGTIPDSLLCAVYSCARCGYKRQGDPLTHMKTARIDHLWPREDHWRK